MPLKVNSIAIIICGFLTLLCIKKLPYKKLLQFPLLLFPLLFLLLLLGMIYTENLKAGQAILERHYSLLFIPFIASSYTLFNKNQQKRVLNAFVISLSVAAFYCLSYAIVDYFETGSVYIDGRSGHFLYNKFMHHRLTAPLGMHAVYFSLYLSLSFLILLNRFIKNYQTFSISKRNSLYILFSFFALMLILLKSSLFALAFPIAILILLFIHFKAIILNNTKNLISTIAVFIVVAGFSFYGIQSKLLNLSTDLKLTDQHPGTLKIRLGVWYSSWETIKDNWLLGAGTGDGHDALIEKYNTLNFFIGKKDQFNAHNMFLEYWISNGVFTSLFYAFILISFSLYFIRKKQFVPFLMVFLFAAYSLTESTMLRQSGVVFFILFCSIFYFHLKTPKPIT